jgi:transcriptional regulator with XRE-family HTH domain
MQEGFDDVRERLAQHIRALREQRQLSQEQLAFDAEIDRTYISQLERGTCNPSLKIIFKVATALNVNLIDLLR